MKETSHKKKSISHHIDDRQLRYKVKSALLEWREDEKTLRVLKSDNTVNDYDFREIFFPPCKGNITPVSIASNDLYINTLLFQIDISIGRCKEKSKDKLKVVATRIYIYVSVMTYYRERGIYRLNEIQQRDIECLAKELGKNHTYVIFGFEKRWQKALADLDLHETEAPKNVIFNIDKKGRIESLNKRYWEKRLGYGACSYYSHETKQIINEYCQKRSYVFAAKFQQWLERDTSRSQVSRSSFYKTLMSLNHLSQKEDGVDHLNYIPFLNALKYSYKYCKNGDDRTDNIPLSDAVYIIKRSLEIVFEYGPAFVEILKKIRQEELFVKIANSNVRKNKSFNDLLSKQIIDFLKNDKPFDILTERMQLPPIRSWADRTGKITESAAISLMHLIAIIQGACCIVILFLNGRRIGEIADKSTGLRTTDLYKINEELGIFLCNFYIEKTYQDRHLFYVNRSTACAIQLLVDMKVALSDLMMKPNNVNLFSICNPVPLMRSINLNLRYFNFGEINSVLSIFTLTNYLYPDGAPDLASHMGRRFFALLYHYRYDNSDLLSLKQHLRHFTIVMTKVYITDPDFRDEAKNIAATIGNRKDVTLVEKKLVDSLELEYKKLEDEIEAVGKERLTDVITRIISGDQSGGGFPRYIRKLFRRFASDINFVNSPAEVQGQIISERLQAQGYKPNCMPHGQCNAPTKRNALNARCRDEENQTNTQRACASLCRECPYHYNNNGFLKNLEEDAEQLKEDMNDFMLPPMQQERARTDYENLIQIIELNKINMVKNSDLMKLARMELCE
ncbi:hypothetical protein IVG45_17220 [Methylomonas sp. LL1]|uniref:hypothetical protein n=1 Tax=Methylomonas sp. LL1 TaxID=2785785 RepID=UPI0018C3FD12|nr:hypothetical protein [Methylomonas sp. LL1]QPK62574.1 hypothetical protein IVG45_17220 [Methylomonas sp. LL1]